MDPYPANRTRSSFPLRAVLLVCVAGAGCSGPGVANDDDEATPAPVSPIIPFEDSGPERGLVTALQSSDGLEGVTSWGTGGRLVARDLDGDGDIDLLFAEFTGAPLVYLNDGAGFFSEVDAGFSLPSGTVTIAATVADLTADGVADLLLSTRASLLLCAGLGDGRFGEPSTLFSLDEPTKVDITNIAVGDVDGDNVSDLLLSTSGYQIVDGEPLELAGAPDVLLLRSDEGLEQVWIEADAPGSSALLATLTDFDTDGDLDIYVPQDEGLPGLMFRSSGGGDELLEVSAAIGVDVQMSAMGFDSADLNGDGRLDYCISDIGNPVCLLSEGAQGFVNGTTALGLADPAVGWGLALGDLDNDGFVELLQASGPSDDADPGENATAPQPNRVWRGLPGGGFAPLGPAIGFDSTDNDLGVATVDLDGDGSLDVVLAGPGRAPKLWMNRPGGAWIEVIVQGPAGSPESFGAQVSLRIGDVRVTREITSSRGPNQGAARAHFGLGGTDVIERMEVRWPDGAVVELRDVTAGQVLRVVHP